MIFGYSYTFKYRVEFLGRKEEELALAADVCGSWMNTVGFKADD